MKIGAETRCDGCACKIDLDLDIVIRSDTLTFCEASCVQDYLRERVPAGHQSRFTSSLRPDDWRRLGSRTDF